MPALTLLLPVTRDWTRERVVAAIAASDIPRGRCILVLDAPGCEAWESDMSALGFDVSVTATGNRQPPDDAIAARARHLAMRRLTQELVPDGPLLCLEDDTLVPPNVYKTLKAALKGRRAATGVQCSRHGSVRAWGVWRGMRTLGTGEQDTCDAAGHYCLLTTGEVYRESPMDPGAKAPSSAVDYAHTRHMRPIGIAWDAVCGHITKRRVIVEAVHVHAYTERGGAHTVPIESIRLPNGLVHWYDQDKANASPFAGDGNVIKEDTKVQTPAGELYRCQQRVVGNGVVLAAPKQLVPVETARAWARCGFIRDVQLYDPREEFKPIEAAPEVKAPTKRRRKKATRPNS